MNRRLIMFVVSLAGVMGFIGSILWYMQGRTDVAGLLLLAGIVYHGIAVRLHANGFIEEAGENHSDTPRR